MGLLDKAKQRRIEEITREINLLLKEKDALIKKKEVLSKEIRKKISSKYVITYNNIDRKIAINNKKVNNLAVKMSKESFVQIQRYIAGNIMEIRGVHPTLYLEFIRAKEELQNLHKQRSWIDKQISSTVGVVEVNLDYQVIAVLNKIGSLVTEKSKIRIKR